MGSAFKPLVYGAALQLGWNSADNLNNSRNVFVYHGQPYFPRPDHISPYKWVSMSWAGVHSENLASVWLLSHLCDQLNLQQLSEVADYVGLGPKKIDGKNEPYRNYRARIRDHYGILITRDVLRATAYRQAVENLETDFIFDGMIKEYEILKALPYGLDYDVFSEDIDNTLEQQSKKLSDGEISELVLRKKLLANYYLKLESLRKDLANYRSLIEPGAGFGGMDSVDYAGSASLYQDRLSGEIHFVDRLDVTDDLARVDPIKLRNHLAVLDDNEKSRLWQNVKLDGGLTVAAFDKVAEQVAYEYKKLSDALPYSIEVLSQVEDFRITVGLYYIIRLAEQLGIKSDLDPVLSFPLGSNVVTLLEATRMYEGLVSGQVTTFGDSDQEESNDSMAILDRIESAEGEILFQPKSNRKRVFDEKSSIEIGNILENVIKFGTGRGAAKEVRFRNDGLGGAAKLSDLNLSVPLLGKTGTANRYTNASFFGYLPGVAENGLAMNLSDGYAIGVYVGFDDNTAMRRNSSHISGAVGALPTWCGIANDLLLEQHYASRLDPVDLSFYGLGIQRSDLGQVNVGVDPQKGGRVIEPVVQVHEMNRSQPSILTFGKKTDAGRFVPERNFRPFWITAGEGAQ